MSTAPSSRAPASGGRAWWRWNASRRAVTLGLLVFVATGALGWRVSQSQEEKHHADERLKVQNRLNGLSTSLASAINRRQGLVDAFRAFAELHGADPEIPAEFALYAAGLQASDPVIRLLQLFPPSGPALVYPISNNDAVRGLTLQDLLGDERPHVRAAVRRTIGSRATTISDPYELRPGGIGVVARQAIFRHGTFWGMAVVILDLERLLQQAGMNGAEELRLAVKDSAGQVFFGREAVFRDRPAIATVPLPDGSWTLAAAPTAGWSAETRNLVASIQLSAFLIAVLFGGAAFVIARRQASLEHAVAARTRELAASEKESRRRFEEADSARQSADASRTQITQTLERISDGFAILDRNWRYQFVNPKLAELVGRRREDLIGRDLWTVFPEAIGTPVQAADLQAAAEQRPIDLELFYAPLGRWFQHRFYPSSGGLSVFSRDITLQKQAEDSRQASEEQFRLLVTQAPLPMCFSDHQENLRFVNDRFVRFFGYTLAEIPTLAAWWQRAFPDAAYREQTIATWKASLGAAMRGGGDLGSSEYRVTCKDGTVCLIVISGTLMQGGVLATFNDVTDRRMAEEQARAAQVEATRLLEEAELSRRALLSVVENQKQAQLARRANEERYRNLVETSFDWMWELDADLRYTYCSPRVKDLLGVDAADVIGRTPFDLTSGAEASRWRGALDSFVAARLPFTELANVKRHCDGRLVVLESNGVPVFAPDGTWLGYRGMDRDITARCAAERTMRLHNAALEAAANAVLITDTMARIEWANPAFTKLSGWTLAEVAGKNPRDFLKSGEHDARFYRQMWETLLLGQVWRGEVVNRRKDGKLRAEDMTITPVRDGQGEITHFIAIKQDITDRKTMQQQLLQAQRMEAIGTLAGGIAHDLNNILAPILLGSGMLRERVDDQADRELLDMMQTSAKHGADIIKQLLTFSRGHMGERVVVQTRYLIKEMVQMMRETFPRDIDLCQSVPANLWPVAADPTQMHQVLLNLCVNARDAMPTGGSLTVTAANISPSESDAVLPPTLKAGAYVVIEVSDTGNGISPDVQHRIFDPFFTTKEVGKGTGLGLSTVMGIVQNHDGFITVNSGPAKGTTFKVYLPAITESPEAPVESTGPAPASTTAFGNGHTVLVVDDELEIRTTIRLLLEQQGFQVITAANGQEALGLYMQHGNAINLVLTDLMMPVMNGLALVRALLAINPALKIVAASGLSDIAQRKELESLGVTDVLLKPFAGPALLNVLRTSLGNGIAGHG